MFMAFLEISDFCELEEYRNNIHRRAVESELQVDEIYTLMMQLEDSKNQAAKQVVMIEKVSRDCGLVAVRFAFLDEDLNAEDSVVEKMSDGLIEGFDEGVFVDLDADRVFNVKQGYLRDYFDDEFGGFMRATESLSSMG